MTSSLAAFQSALGLALMGRDGCPIDEASAGFRFTATVRRSWCEGRATIAARTVLALLPEAERRRLLKDYVDAGGGLAMFFPAENAAFLEFLAPRLPDPSHALSLCRMDRALARARLGAETFASPSPDGARRASLRCLEHEAWGCIETMMREPAANDVADRMVRGRIMHQAWGQIEHPIRHRIEPGPHAALVWFHADPEAVLKALYGGPVPPVGDPAWPLLFAPGLPHLYRAASEEEAALWGRLPADDARIGGARLQRLLAEGVLVLAE
jgi:hypothetical protein